MSLKKINVCNEKLMTWAMSLQKRHLSTVVQLTTPVQTRTNASHGGCKKANI